MTDDVPLPDKVAAFFRQLKTAAAELNAVSDELGGSIEALDQTLRMLNLGVSTWVNVLGSLDSDSDGNYWAEQLGYAKVGSKWGISLRTIQGNDNVPENEIQEQWLFNDAPRALRVRAVDKLPELLDGLTKEATSTAERIKGKIDRAEQVVAAIKEATQADRERAQAQKMALGATPKQRK